MSDLSVAQVAKELRIRRSAVVQLLESGVMAGYDASWPGARRRTYRVTRDALEAFKAKRGVHRTPVSSRRKVATDVREFF